MLTRRELLAGAAGAVSATAFPVVARSAARPREQLEVVLPGSRRFAELAARGYNPRFRARPHEILVPGDGAGVLRAVSRAVDSGSTMGLRSGGHCFEGFADRPSVRTVIDLSRLRAVTFDPAHRAFAIGPGADLGTVYRSLHERWGVAIPGGTCLGVGAAGLISGGGFGGLSRRFGAAADYLYGVEVVTVDAGGRAALTVATRDGPHRDLWWAHTGGGGGNFGVITRLLLRSPESDGADPRSALPRPPRRMRVGSLHLTVATPDAFVSFVGNYLAYLARHASPEAPETALYSTLQAGAMPASGCSVQTYYDASAQKLYDGFVAAVGRGVFPPPVPGPTTEAPFLPATLRYCTPRGRSAERLKFKSAFLRAPFSESQLRTLYAFLSRPEIAGSGSGIQFYALGGRIGAVPSGATALAERTSIAKFQVLGAWTNPGQTEARLRWVRDCYRELYRHTGGVPRPDRRNGGCYINYPDTDMIDRRWNPAVPWHALYYQENYRRLREVKASWDPQNHFRHPLGVRA